MEKIALFLISFLIFSCIPSKPNEDFEKRYADLRQIKKEDQNRMNKLKKLESLYKLRGKESRATLIDFTEGLIDYLKFLIETAPKVRADLDWLENNKKPSKVRVSLYLSGGRTIEERKKNMAKGIWDVRMYDKRLKNLEARLKKKEPVSVNEVSNIKYPL